MRRFILVLIAAAVPLEPASPADLSIRSFFSQGFSGISRFGDTNDSGGLRSTTDLGLNFQGATPRTTYGVDVGLRGTLRSDDDGDDDTLFDYLNPTLNGSIRHVGTRYSTFATVSLVPQFVSDRDFENVLILDNAGNVIDIQQTERNIDPLQITFTARGGGSLRLNTRDSVTTSLFARLREYSDTSDDFQPNRTFGANAGWSRAFDQNTSGGLSFSLRHFTTEEAGEDDSTSFGMNVNASRRFTSRHSGSLSLGVTAVDSDVLDADFTGAASFNYKPTNAATFSFSASQAVDQDDQGRVRTVTALRANANYRVNGASTFSIGAALSADTPVGSDVTGNNSAFTLSAQYRYRFAEGWNLGVGYGFQVETDTENFGDDFSGSNRLFLRVSRNLDLLP